MSSSPFPLPLIIISYVPTLGIALRFGRCFLILFHNTTDLVNGMSVTEGGRGRGQVFLIPHALVSTLENGLWILVRGGPHINKTTVGHIPK